MSKADDNGRLGEEGSVSLVVTRLVLIEYGVVAVVLTTTVFVDDVCCMVMVGYSCTTVLKTTWVEGSMDV